MPEPINPNPAPSGTPQPPAPVAQPVQGVTVEQFNGLTEQVKQMAGFVEDAAFILSGIYSDPALRVQVQQKFTGTPPATPPATLPEGTPPVVPPATPPATPPAPPQDPRINDMDMKSREDIVARVEAKYGYNTLQGDARKTLRRNVEKRLNVWGGSVMDSPVSALTGLLEDAYLLEDMGKAKEEGRIQGLIDARMSDMGALPTMGNQSPQPETTVLSADQQKWTNRWGLNADKVTERLKEFQETGVMTYKAPEAAAPAIPAPSGTPTPPPPAVPAAVPQPQNAQ